MCLFKFAATLLLSIPLLAESPLPELRVEPTAGGSIFYIKNTSSQPLTAYLIELVDYPGSSFSFWQDEAGIELIAPGAEKRIPVANMTTGAVPEYVKMRAAVYADGSSSGIPEKVTQLIERRRFLLSTTRELIGRLDKAQAKDAVIADLKKWSESMPAPTRSNRNTQPAINAAAAKALVEKTAASVQAGSVEDTLKALRTVERTLAASKPAL